MAKAAADAAKAEAEAAKVKQEVTTDASSKVASAVAKVSRRDGNVKQWARWMADQLRHVPDIKSFGKIRLSDLTEQGPAAARGMWATAKDALLEQYGNVTVEDLLKEFGTPQS